MEAMSENKMVPSDYSTGPMEKAAKPLPFKDPNFVVRRLLGDGWGQKEGPSH